MLGKSLAWLFGRWREAARLALGVLLVWGVVAALSGMARSVMRGDSSSWRLHGGEFCYVNDFMAPNFRAPTVGFVYDREYQLNRGPLKAEEHVTIAEVDWHTLVQIDYDVAEESIKKGEPGRRAVDERLVHVFYILGPLTGRKGGIARYKLAPLDTR